MVESLLPPQIISDRITNMEALMDELYLTKPVVKHNLVESSYVVNLIEETQNSYVGLTGHRYKPNNFKLRN